MMMLHQLRHCTIVYSASSSSCLWSHLATPHHGLFSIIIITSSWTSALKKSLRLGLARYSIMSGVFVGQLQTPQALRRRERELVTGDLLWLCGMIPHPALLGVRE
jgi:hypothetical protein